MKCPVCEKGKLTVKEVDVVKHGIFVGHFKAEVCSACGEQIFSSPEATKIEAKMKELGLFGPEPSTVYKVGGNLAISIRKRVAQIVGATKDSKPIIIPQAKERRLIIEFPTR
ncbi:MAG: YgiT-type zinc finger protein [Candidatus Micrarchaeota archaeon]